MSQLQPLIPRPEVLDFLATRRSRPAKTLSADAPEPETLTAWLAIAARTPDHGKLAPWRFAVMGPQSRATAAAEAVALAPDRGLDGPAAAKAAAQFGQAGAVVAVIASPVAGAKIPVWEQELSAGAVCLALLNAALASGWGANWLTGPYARDERFLSAVFGTAPGEFVAGFIHIGRETLRPTERDRPALEQKIAWMG